MGIVLVWTSSYPTSIDDKITNFPAVTNNIHDVLASHVNELADAVIALQTVLGGFRSTPFADPLSPSNGDVLFYNNGTGEWEAGPPGASITVTMQDAYDDGATILQTTGKPVAITTFGVGEDGITITDGVDTVAIKGDRVISSDGTAALPSYGFVGTVGMGFYNIGGSLNLSFGSTQVWRWSNGSSRGPDGLTNAPAYSFLSDTNSGLWHISPDRIGLSTNSVTRFDVGNSIATLSVPVRGPDGSVGAPTYTYTTDTTTGLWSPGVGLAAVSGAGAEAVRWNGDGQTLHPDGTAALPAITRSAQVTTGIYFTNNALHVTLTTTPTYSFLSNTLRGPDGVVGAPTFSFLNNTASGMYSISGGKIGFATDSILGFALETNLTGGGAATAFEFTPTVNKSGGDYTAIKLNVTPTAVPGTDNRLLDLQVSGVSQAYITDAGRLITNATNANGSATEPTVQIASNMGMYHISGVMRFSTASADRLHVSSSGLRTMDGSEATPAYSFISETGDGLYSSGAADVSLSLGASQSYRWTSTFFQMIPTGSATNAALIWGGDIDTGFHKPGADRLNITVGGVDLLAMKYLDAPAGDEVAFEITPTVDKLTSGNYTALLVNVDELTGTGPAPASSNRLLDLQIDGVTQTYITDTGDVRAGNGSQAAPSLSFATATGHGLYYQSATQMNASVDGAIILKFVKTAFQPQVEMNMFPKGSATNPAISWTSDGGTGFQAVVPGTLGISSEAGAIATFRRLLDETTGDEVSIALTPTISKATSGDYTALLLNVDEASLLGPAPGSSNRLLDLQIDGVSQWTVDDTGTLIVGNVPVGTLPDPLLLSSGTAADPTYSFSSSSDTGLFRPAAGRAAITTDGVVALTVEGQLTHASNNETAFDYVTEVTKAGGNYTGIKLNVTPTGVTGSDDRLLDLQVSGVSQAFVSDVGNYRAGIGLATAAAFQVGETGLGLYRPGTNRLGVTVNSTLAGEFQTNQVVWNDGSITQPTWSWRSEQNSGLWRPGAGAAQMVILATASQLWSAEGSSFSGALTAATGDETSYDFGFSVDKATSGAYTGMEVTVTEVNAQPLVADNYVFQTRLKKDGTGDSFTGPSGSTMTLIDSAGGFTNNLIGKSIVITSATTPANDGTFTVTDVLSATSMEYTNAAGVAEVFAGTWAFDEVLHALRSNGQLSVNKGSVSLPGFSFLGDTNTGFTAANDGQLSVVLNGTEEFRFVTQGASISQLWSSTNGTATLPNFAAWNASTGIFFSSGSVMAVTNNGTESVRWNGDQQTVLTYVDATTDEALPKLSLGDVSTGFWRHGSGRVAFSSGGVETLVLRPHQHCASGSVGLPATPPWTFETDRNTGMYRAAADTLGFSTNGVAVFSLRHLIDGATTVFNIVPNINQTGGHSTGYDLLRINAGVTADAGTGEKNMIRTELDSGTEFRVDTEGRVFADIGAVGTPSYSFEADPDTGLYSTTNALRVAAGGAEVFALRATANTNALVTFAPDLSGGVTIFGGEDIATAGSTGNDLALKSGDSGDSLAASTASAGGSLDLSSGFGGDAVDGSSTAGDGGAIIIDANDAGAAGAGTGAIGGAIHLRPGVSTDGGDNGALFLGTTSAHPINVGNASAKIGFYGATPVVLSSVYSRDATIVTNRTLLASASATALNNNNVLAALIADLQAVGIIG